MPKPRLSSPFEGSGQTAAHISSQQSYTAMVGAHRTVCSNDSSPPGSGQCPSPGLTKKQNKQLTSGQETFSPTQSTLRIHY